MSNLGYTPAKAGSSRVFVIEGGARPDNSPSFKSCLRALGISAGFGDVESIECPDPDSYNNWIEVGEIQGAEERPTTGLQGRYAQDEESTLLRIGKLRCKLDIHVHFGACTDPGDFNTFTKAVVFELASLTNYSTDDLGALSSDEEASITESVDVSAKAVYEILPLSFSERCGISIVAPIADIVICDSPACGECEQESDGCQIQFAVTSSSAGSPGTAPDLVWTDDKWATCHRDDITSLLASETANALACLGDYVVVVSNDSNSLHYKTKALILAGTAFNWVEVATGFVLTGEPRDIWAAGVDTAFIVGDGGYIYVCSDPASGVTVLDAGVATTEDLYAVHAIDPYHAVAVGANDAIVYTTDGLSWGLANANPGTGDTLYAVWMVSERIWWVGGAAGTLWYTINHGDTWTQVALPGTAPDNIWDIAFASEDVGYIASDTATPRGRIYRTYSGGGGTPPMGGWVIMPEGTATLPLCDSLYCLAACAYDVNFVAAGGLADDATDGIIITGAD